MSGAHQRAEEPEEEARTVRPYAVTGGRTRAAGLDLPLEALVRAFPGADQAPGVTLERRQIVELTTREILSVAEISAHLKLPLGVARVLIGDLAAAGLVRVHNQAVTASRGSHLDVLESVLNGISQL